MSTLVSDIRSTDWSLSLTSSNDLVQGVDDIRQCIYTICKTIPGSDPLRPLFGCNIYQFLDKPVNVAIPNAILTIIEAIGMWEPRVEVTAISPVIDGGKVTFTILFQVLNTTDTGQVDVTYGLTA